MYSKMPILKTLGRENAHANIQCRSTLHHRKRLQTPNTVLCARQIRYFPYIDADDGPYEESQVRLSDAMPTLQWSFTSFVSLHSQIEGKTLLGRYGRQDGSKPAQRSTAPSPFSPL